MTRLNVKEAAKYVPCGESTLNRLRSQGGGPVYTKPAGRVLYDTNELDKWIAKSNRRSTSDDPLKRRPLAA